MDLDREIRLRYRDLVLAMGVGLAVDLALVVLIYAVDVSPLGPLRRFGGPWGLPCIAVGRCAPPLLPADPLTGLDPPAQPPPPARPAAAEATSPSPQQPPLCARIAHIIDEDCSPGPLAD